MHVYGGSGFVGSNIAKLYADWHDVDVTVAARRPAQTPDPGKFAELDLLDRDAVRKIVLSNASDLIVHAAILNDFNRLYVDRRLGWDTRTRSASNSASTNPESASRLMRSGPHHARTRCAVGWVGNPREPVVSG